MLKFQFSVPSGHPHPPPFSGSLDVLDRKITLLRNGVQAAASKSPLLNDKAPSKWASWSLSKPFFMVLTVVLEKGLEAGGR